MSRNPLRTLSRPLRSRVALSLLAALSLLPAAGRAEGASDASPSSSLSAEAPLASDVPTPQTPPLAQLTPPADALPPAGAPPQADRRKGWDIQGVPAINFNTDEGFGYGAILMLVDRGDGSYEPFRYSVMLQFFQTTNQVASHFISLDAPRFLDSQWRMGMELAYARTLFAPYYGLGNTAAYVTEFSDCDDRDSLKANPDVCPDNPDFRGLRYYTYDHRSLPKIRLNARRELSQQWRIFLGYRLRMDRIRMRYSADDLGQSSDSKLIEDASSGVLDSHEGNLTEPLSERTSEVMLGLQYDTRDIEAAPTLGMFHELSVRGGAGVIGSQFNYWGATLHTRFFHPVIPGYSRLVMGWRGLLDVMGGDVPISLLPVYGGFENKDGLGGVYSARGILLRRYQGPVKLLLNAELRWTALSVKPWGQDFDFTLAGFVDSGRVWSNLHFNEGGGLKTSAGGGLRIGWNREFVIRLDYGVGITEPTTGFYLDIGHIF
ncbi:Omp85 family outer membrane protein [Hyalangium versicolor]|uniref:Omp85 family outer membrane protein n=1 Tax=Hyalangium versicolor TaxID=2861190 RepID=UPI001CC9D9BA|nr:BamA/TamA family outer membrane protein [Hyalangium versicolor]